LSEGTLKDYKSQRDEREENLYRRHLSYDLRTFEKLFLQEEIEDPSRVLGIFGHTDLERRELWLN
jgi:hypothetical protein